MVPVGGTVGAVGISWNPFDEVGSHLAAVGFADCLAICSEYCEAPDYSVDEIDAAGSKGSAEYFGVCVYVACAL